GYATFSASSSASVEWTVSVPTAKTYSVVIRFANGSGTSMTGKMNANGGSYTSFSLSTTASWSTWTTKAVNLRLNAGTNRVRLAAGSSRGLPSVDRLDVNDGATTATYALTIAVNGNGSTNPSIGSHSYAAGTVVSVTAIPASGATFTGWSGAASGAANPIAITMDAAKALTANFSGGVTTYTLTISTSGNGSTSPAAGTYRFASGTSVTITATPSSGATFSGWSGACVGTGSCVVSMTANRTVTATFAGGPTGLFILTYRPTTAAADWAEYLAEGIGSFSAPGTYTVATQGTGTARTVHRTILVAQNTTYDGRGEVLTPVDMGDGSQSEGQIPVFLLEPGATLKNVTITAPGVEGVHMMGNNRLENVHWTDVGEDAASVRTYFPGGDITIVNSSAHHASDKVFQFNAPVTVRIKNFTASDMGKLIRQNGGTTFPMTVYLDGVTVNDVSSEIVRSDSPSCYVYYHDVVSDLEPGEWWTLRTTPIPFGGFPSL
ncbi:MAG TPA: pectate lyase, partial [Anaeromyxobacter sp.]|nr:pectate lyase [Anaeromyxobacter sp.]